MEFSATSFRNLLLQFSKAVAVKQSPNDYANLLREIFAERGTYAEEDIQPQFAVQNSQILFGRDSEVEQLLSKLLDPNEKGIQLSVIAIIGDRGIGKTALARIVYNDVAVKEHFDVQAWVTFEGEEFKLQQAAQLILKSTMGMSFSVDDLDELDEMVRDTLNSRKCLIVFDGIESMGRDFWLHMNKHWFDFVDLGSKVLVTTPSKDVVDLVSTISFELEPLSRDGFWLLWYQYFNSSNTSRAMAANLEYLCGGVPLLLKLVGSLMRYDVKMRDLLCLVDFLDDISWPASGASVAIFLCVWALPSHLRQCFAYCAAFPKGYALNREKIIRMWIARGLVKPSPGNNSLEDVGNAYFLQLLHRSFFTDTTFDQYGYGDVVEFRIPSLIRDIGEDVARIVYSEKLGLIGSIGEDAGHLSLLSFRGKYKSEDLQTLILAPTLCLPGSLDHSILDFYRLQSLDLSCSGIQTLSDDIRALRELRHLNLSYTLIERLPDSFTALSQLKTLDLSWCYHFKVLPKDMRNLAHMCHLDLSQCESLSHFPSGIGFLISLTSMPLFVLGKDSGSARLGELGLLNQLRGRLEIRNLENVMEISEARKAKIKQKNLYHLVLSWGKDVGDCFEILELLQPHQLLKVLDITGYVGSRFPRWVSSITNIIKISITDCGCKELPSLGQLPFLKELQLIRMMNLECIDQEFYGAGVSGVFFPSLEQLELYDLPRLFKWSGARVSRLSGLVGLCCSGETAPNASSNYMFCSLKTLTVEGCPKLPSLPSLPTLPNLILKNNCSTIICSLTSFTSLSSLLINDMKVWPGEYFGDLATWESLKKLVLCNIRDESIRFFKEGSLSALEHLVILHCQKLTDLSLNFFPSLKKLHIVDCPRFSGISVEEEENTQLMELVVEDCPQANANLSLHKFHYLRKLILKNCSSDFSMGYAGESKFKKLEKLEYMSISGSLKLVSQFKTFPWLISHIPCIIVGSRKVNFKDSKDLLEVLISASNEPKSEVTMLPVGGSSHGPQKSITNQFIQNVMDIKYNEIKKATRNFSPDMVLGEGGFSTVYKGWIDEHNLTAVKPGSGVAVAVKTLNAQSCQGHEEWLKAVKYLSQLRHPNLVRLIGSCIEKDNRILVYEFMPKGSLVNHLFTSRLESLSWKTRINVAVGAARGLSFLHEIPVILRDVKSSDILLDGEFNAKLSDFGLAKDGPVGDMSHVSTQVIGTHGYAAPEYIATGHLYVKSDVYGFGVVLLELLTGRRALDTKRPAKEQNLVGWAKPNLVYKRKLSRIMDPRLDGKYSLGEAYKVAKLAMQCLHAQPNERPGMAAVVVALEKLLLKTL